MSVTDIEDCTAALYEGRRFFIRIPMGPHAEFLTAGSWDGDEDMNRDVRSRVSRRWRAYVRREQIGDSVRLYFERWNHGDFRPGVDILAWVRRQEPEGGRAWLELEVNDAEAARILGATTPAHEFSAAPVRVVWCRIMGRGAFVIAPQPLSTTRRRTSADVDPGEARWSSTVQYSAADGSTPLGWHILMHLNWSDVHSAFGRVGDGFAVCVAWSSEGLSVRPDDGRQKLGRTILKTYHGVPGVCYIGAFLAEFEGVLRRVSRPNPIFGRNKKAGPKPRTTVRVLRSDLFKAGELLIGFPACIAGEVSTIPSGPHRRPPRKKKALEAEGP